MFAKRWMGEEKTFQLAQQGTLRPVDVSAHILRYLKSVVGLAVIVMAFSVTNAFGCFCGGGGAPCEDYGKAAAVFVGTALARAASAVAAADSVDAELAAYNAERRS